MVTERPVLVAPDSFKGTFRASEVAAAVGRGLERAGLRPPDLCPVADGGEGAIDAPLAPLGGPGLRPPDLCPVADGGEGTIDALLPRLGGEVVGAEAHDPLGRELRAGF